MISDKENPVFGQIKICRWFPGACTKRKSPIIFLSYAVCEKPEPVTYCVSYSIRASIICHSLTTRCYAAQTVARWQKLAQISLRKPRNGHGVSVFRYPASKNILRLFLSYTLRKETASRPANVRKKFYKSTLSASR